MTRRRSGAALGAGLVAAGLLALLFGGLWLVVRDRPVAPPLRTVVAPPGPHPAPRTLWTPAELADLLGAVERAGGQGLRVADYRVDALRAAVGRHRTDSSVDAFADTTALSLARDYATGRVRDRHRFNWYIDGNGPRPAELARGIVAARMQGRLQGWLEGLLPSDAAYRALRDALASTSPDDEQRRDRIRANMERWRWLPRDFGRADKLYVNLPTYRLDVVQGGRTIATYRAVIGATDMPTPALSVPVRQVIANPDWIVPQSIVRRSHLRPGASSRYIFTTRPDGTVRVRQKPGPGNALGRVKIVFPNPLAIYFHDTPSRSLFGASERAFSHGCVRVQNIEVLAASLVARPGRFSAALEDTRTRAFAPAHGWQAVIVYLTLVPDEAGALVDVGDPYRMDEALAAALDGRKPGLRQTAAKVSPGEATPAPAPASARPDPNAGVDPDDAIVAAPGNATATDTPPATPGNDIAPDLPTPR